MSELAIQGKNSPNYFIRTEGISFPRSGHGALIKVLSTYFGSDFIYCGGIHEKNCGCMNSPCTNPNLQFSKNHDFGISTGKGSIIKPNQQYIVQYRNPVRSIVSDYEIFMAANPDKNAKRYWFPFAHAKMNYWNKFVDKWLIGDLSKKANILPVPYERFITFPQTVVPQIIKFITKKEVDMSRLDYSVKKNQLSGRNRYKDFQFYDEDFFTKLESFAGNRLEILSIPSFENSI